MATMAIADFTAETLGASVLGMASVVESRSARGRHLETIFMVPEASVDTEADFMLQSTVPFTVRFTHNTLVDFTGVGCTTVGFMAADSMVEETSAAAAGRV